MAKSSRIHLLLFLARHLSKALILQPAGTLQPLGPPFPSVHSPQSALAGPALGSLPASVFVPALSPIDVTIVPTSFAVEL